MSNVILTRHGRSQTNVDQDLKLRELGRVVEINVRNNVLTLEGVEGALELGRQLKRDANVQTIVTSPYACAKQTAYLVATALESMPMIHYDSAFKEIQWKIAGKFHRLEESIPNFDSKTLGVYERPVVDRKRRAYTLESQADVYARVVPALLRTCRRYGSRGDLLIVAHYFVLKALIAWFEHDDVNAMSTVDVRNTSPFVLPLERVLERSEP